MKRLGRIGVLLLLLFPAWVYAQKEVLFSHEGGFYDEPFLLSLGCSDLDCHIRFTTNGNTPTSASRRYDAPMMLDETLYSSADIFRVPVTPADDGFYPDSVRHAIVIRAAAFDGTGRRVGDVVTHTYLIRALGCQHAELPVVSLCCDSLSLFDYDTGIMVPGAFFDPEDPELTGNYFMRGREWERLANVEFYEQGNLGINQQCGLRMHGHRARKAAAKGMKIYAREEYGKKRFKHRFFETTSIRSFKHLVLKPFSTLWPYVGVQDDVANRVAAKIGLEAPASRPVVLYLNGEYWGLYFFQEKMDDRYLEDHFGIDPEQCNIIDNWGEEVEAGEGVGFGQLMQWLEDADLADSLNYAYLKSLVDVDNFVDYQIFETYIANFDWPANNVRCWQNNHSKWRFVFYDGDASMLEKDLDVLEHATYIKNDKWNTGPNSTLMFRRLLENNGFKTRFNRRVDELCNSFLRYDSIAPILDRLVQALQDEMPNHIKRFGNLENIWQWYYGIGLVRDFLAGRDSDYQTACLAFESLKEHDYQVNTDDFCVYPNPAEDAVNVKMMDGRSRVVNFDLKDSSGRSYGRGKVYVPACEPLRIPLELPPGVYILQIGNKAHRMMKL